MRRKDREIKDFDKIIDILNRSKILNLAMISEGHPYSVPVNFGYTVDEKDGVKQLSVYFHGAGEGKKVSALGKNPDVSFNAVSDSEIVCLSDDKADPCSYSCLYESVIGFGKAELLTDRTEKTKGMDSIMSHNGYRLNKGVKFIAYNMMYLAKTAIFKITVNEITGKAHKK